MKTTCPGRQWRVGDQAFSAHDVPHVRHPPRRAKTPRRHSQTPRKRRCNRRLAPQHRAQGTPSVTRIDHAATPPAVRENGSRTVLQPFPHTQSIQRAITPRRSQRQSAQPRADSTTKGAAPPRRGRRPTDLQGGSWGDAASPLRSAAASPHRHRRPTDPGGLVGGQRPPTTHRYLLTRFSSISWRPERGLGSIFWASTRSESCCRFRRPSRMSRPMPDFQPA